MTGGEGCQGCQGCNGGKGGDCAAGAERSYSPA